MKLVIYALTVVVGLAAASRAQTDRMTPGPPHDTRLVVGERPPSTFALPAASDGTIHNLDAQRGERPLLLLFFRGVW